MFKIFQWHFIAFRIKGNSYNLVMERFIDWWISLQPGFCLIFSLPFHSTHESQCRQPSVCFSKMSSLFLPLGPEKWHPQIFTHLALLSISQFKCHLLRAPLPWGLIWKSNPVTLSHHPALNFCIVNIPCLLVGLFVICLSFFITMSVLCCVFVLLTTDTYCTG